VKRLQIALPRDPRWSLASSHYIHKSTLHWRERERERERKRENERERERERERLLYVPVYISLRAPDDNDVNQDIRNKTELERCSSFEKRVATFENLKG
jgi:hypothetical protein